MRDQQQCGAALLHRAAQEGDNLLRHFGIEITGRLVRQDQRRFVNQCARDRNPLQLAA